MNAHNPPTLPASESAGGTLPEVPVDALRALARLRREAEAEIERLINLLDRLDPDFDLEPAGDEQDQSWTENRLGRGFGGREDDEPSLGWTSALDQSRHKWLGNNDDREGPDDDREPDVDDEDGHDAEMDLADSEPSLGSFDRMVNQDHSYQDRAGWCSHDDREVGPGPMRRELAQAKRDAAGRPAFPYYVDRGDGVMVAVVGVAR